MHQLGPACAHRHAQARALAPCRGAPAAVLQALARPYRGLGRRCRSSHARAPGHHAAPTPSARLACARLGRVMGLAVHCVAIQISLTPPVTIQSLSWDTIFPLPLNSHSHNTIALYRDTISQPTSRLLLQYSLVYCNPNLALQDSFPAHLGCNTNLLLQYTSSHSSP